MSMSNAAPPAAQAVERARVIIFSQRIGSVAPTTGLGQLIPAGFPTNIEDHFEQTAFQSYNIIKDYIKNINSPQPFGASGIQVPNY